MTEHDKRIDEWITRIEHGLDRALNREKLKPILRQFANEELAQVSYKFFPSLFPTPHAALRIGFHEQYFVLSQSHCRSY